MIRKARLFILFSNVFWFSVNAQNNLFEGHDFGVPIVEVGYVGTDELFIQSSYNACVKIIVPFSHKDTAFNIIENQVFRFKLDEFSGLFDYEELDSIHNKYALVKSNFPLTLVKANSNGLYDTIQSNRKVILCAENYSNRYLMLHGRFNMDPDGVIINMFSLENLNNILIHPQHECSYYRNPSATIASKGNAGNINLDAGQTVQCAFRKYDDMLLGANATLISASKPFMPSIYDLGNIDNPVENAYSCRASSSIFNATNPTYQNKPLYMAGTYYPFTPVNKQGKDYVHLLATRPNTTLFYNGQFVKTLDSLELWDTCFYNAGIISANKPLMFGQFVQRNAVSAQNFEVFSIGVQTSDTSEYIHKTIFDATPNTNMDSTVFPLNITAYTADTALLLHNGLPLQNAGWQPFAGNPNLSWCTYFVQSGVHVLVSNSKFAALYYPHSFDNPPNYLYREVSSYMLPGVTPTQEAADSIQFFYQTANGQKEPWANGPVAACSGVALTLYPNIARHTTWQWHFGDGTTQTQRVGSQRATPISYTWQNPGNYWVTVTDSAGCTAGDSLLVIVENGPQAAFSYTATSSCSGTFVQLQNETVGASSYSWQWPGGSSTATNPSFNFNGQDTTLTVTLIATDGTCSDTAVQNLKLQISNLKQEDIPNVLTPNNDGVNDAFCITATAGYQACFQLEVFNRWGRQVFKTTDPQDCWQPTNLADGVYFYVLTLGQQRYQGEVTVF